MKKNKLFFTIFVIVSSLLHHSARSSSSQVKLWDFRLGNYKEIAIETINSLCDYYHQPSSDILIASNCSTEYNPEIKLEIELQFTKNWFSKNSIIRVKYAYINKEGISNKGFTAFGDKYLEIKSDDLFISSSDAPACSKKEISELEQPVAKLTNKSFSELLSEQLKKDQTTETTAEWCRIEFCFSLDNSTKFFFDQFHLAPTNGTNRKTTIASEIILEGKESGECKDT
jgi:hypothetical protein